MIHVINTILSVYKNKNYVGECVRERKKEREREGDFKIDFVK